MNKINISREFRDHRRALCRRPLLDTIPKTKRSCRGRHTADSPERRRAGRRDGARITAAGAPGGRPPVRAGRLRGPSSTGGDDPQGDSGLMAGDFELPPADVLAYQLAEAAADQLGEDAAAEYLFAFVHEILKLEPGVREHLAREVLADLKDAVSRVEDSCHSHATVRLIEEIEEHWKAR